MDRKPIRLPGPFWKHEDSPFVHGVTPCMEEAVELAEVNRNIQCPHYDACLDTAASQRWLGWACDESCKHRGTKVISDVIDFSCSGDSNMYASHGRVGVTRHTQKGDQ